MKSSDRNTLKKLLRNAGAVLFWIALWQLAAVLVGQELILPGPWAVAKRLFVLAGTGDFWLTAGISLGRILAGFLCGVLLGTLTAVLTCFFAPADAILSPVIRVVRATPVASFIILAFLWIGKTQVPGFISMLMVLPVVCENTAAGIRGTDPLLLEMAKSYRFGFRKTVGKVYVPSVAPAWRAGAVTALGLAWKSGVAAEALCLPRLSLGTEIYYSKIYLETADLFAWTAVVILLSWTLEKGFVALIRRKGGKAA